MSRSGNEACHHFHLFSFDRRWRSSVARCHLGTNLENDRSLPVALTKPYLHSSHRLPPYKFANPDRGGQIPSSQQEPVNSTAAPSPPGSSHGSTWTTAAKPTPASSSPITTATNNGASKSLTSTPRKPRTSSAHSRQAATPLAPAPSSLPCSEASGSFRFCRRCRQCPWNPRCRGGKAMCWPMTSCTRLCSGFIGCTGADMPIGWMAVGKERSIGVFDLATGRW